MDPDFGGAETINASIRLRELDLIQESGKQIHEHGQLIQTERTDEEDFLELFQIARSDIGKAVELVERIYHKYVLEISTRKVWETFSDNFPFEVFFHIVTEVSDPDIQSMAIQSLGEVSDSSFFPMDFFAQPPVIEFFVEVLESDDPLSIKAALRILGNIAGSVPDARDCILGAGIMDRIMMLDVQNTTAAEFVYKVCNLEPPPPGELLDGLIEYLKNVLEIPMEEIPCYVIDLALSSVHSLLEHEAEGVTGDMFYEYLPHMLMSDIPAIVPSVIKILFYISEPTPEIIQLLVQILEEEDSDKPCVLIVLVKLLEKLKDYIIPICGSQVFELIMSKIGGFPYSVEVACLEVAFEYFDTSYISNMEVFAIVLKFVGSMEIACDCMKLLLTMIEKTADTGIQGQMIQMMSEVSSTFEELIMHDDDEIVALAEQCLDLIESAEV